MQFFLTGAIWMEDAQLSNVIYSHPEDRNAHNSGKLQRRLWEFFSLLTNSWIFFLLFINICFAVFGGYLMRQVSEKSIHILRNLFILEQLNFEFKICF